MISTIEKLNKDNENEEQEAGKCDIDFIECQNEEEIVVFRMNLIKP